MAFLEELLLTFAYSKKAQLAFILGPVFFILILLIGNHMADSIHFGGLFAPLADIIRSAIQLRYEHAALGALITFWVIAGKTLIRDRERYLN